MIISRQALFAIMIQCAGYNLLLAGESNGQSVNDVYITLELKEVGLLKVFRKIEAKTDFDFAFREGVRGIKHKFNLPHQQISVGGLLKMIANETGLEFRQINNTINVKPTRPPAPKPEIKETKVNEYDREISGKVTDQNGLPLPGANVLVSGTNLGTTTDVDGNYRLTVPDESVMLVFSYIGYTTEEVEIAGRSVIDMVMLPDIQSLQGVEVVSTGYYEVQQRQNTGNIAKVDAKVIERQPVVNPLEALQGQVPGVFIQQSSGTPGAPIEINIRGLNSLNNGQRLNDGTELPNANLPFIVIDGVPYTAASLNSNELGVFGNGNPLAAFRPQDIESIQVLKDADATAIYGSRGANGVILITTKKGKAGKTRVGLNFSHGLGEVASRAEVLNTEQYLAMRREAIANDGRGLTEGDSIRLSDVFLWDQQRNTDWQEELAGGTAAQTNASIDISGGSARTRFLFRGSFFRQTNVYNYDNSAFESLSGLFNINHTSSNDKFSINLSTNYTVSSNDQNGEGLMDIAVRLAPNAPSLFDETGNLNWSDNFPNPLAILEREYESKTQALISNALLSYKIAPGLSIQSAIGYTNTTVNQLSVSPLSSLPPEERDAGSGFLSLAGSSNETWIIEPQIKYDRVFGFGSVAVQVGATLQGSDQTGITTQGRGYNSDFLIRDITQASETSTAGNIFSEYRYSALYARINYNYGERYVLNLTGRRDGSSRFGPGRRFGNFGAVGVAWLFSEEPFLKDLGAFLSFGKLRASYGVTGNDQIGDYGYLDAYGAPGGIPYNGNASLVVVRAANPEFSWEENRKLEIGVELGLFEDRVNIVGSWFRNRSDNQLIGRPLSGVTGFSVVQFNLPALVENRGVEIELRTVNINQADFTWSSSFNFTRARNELVEFPNIEQFDAFNNTYEVGRSLFGGKQYQSLGVDPETGTYTFVDYNTDGRITPFDQQDFVEVVQDYYGGLSNTVRWKNFQLDIFFRFVKQMGRDFLFSFITPGFGSSDFATNQPPAVLDRWQTFGDSAPIQKFGLTDRQMSDADFRQGGTAAGLTDASFIRLQNLSLSWIVPEKWTERAELSQARLYIQGQNLLTFTPYEGLDPETQGLTLPPLRMVTTGIQVMF